MSEQKPQIIKGWLKKQGEDLLKAYKKRWFYQKEEEETKLYYSKSPGEASLGFIDLSKVTEVKLASSDEFQIVTPDRTYTLKGSNSSSASSFSSIGIFFYCNSFVFTFTLFSELKRSLSLDVCPYSNCAQITQTRNLDPFFLRSCSKSDCRWNFLQFIFIHSRFWAGHFSFSFFSFFFFFLSPFLLLPTLLFFLVPKKENSVSVAVSKPSFQWNLMWTSG